MKARDVIAKAINPIRPANFSADHILQALQEAGYSIVPTELANRVADQLFERATKDADRI